MRWLIYQSNLAGEFLGTVDAGNRYDAQRKAAAGFWETRTPRPPQLQHPEQLAQYWPIQVPTPVRGSR